MNNSSSQPNGDPVARTTEVTVLPFEVDDWDESELNHFAIQVAYRGSGLYGILKDGKAYGKNGKWCHERIPSARTDTWRSIYRWDKDTAIEVALALAPTILSNGLTAQDAYALYKMDRAEERKAFIEERLAYNREHFLPLRDNTVYEDEDDDEDEED